MASIGPKPDRILILNELPTDCIGRALSYGEDSFLG